MRLVGCRESSRVRFMLRCSEPSMQALIFLNTRLGMISCAIWTTIQRRTGWIRFSSIVPATGTISCWITRERHLLNLSLVAPVYQKP